MQDRLKIARNALTQAYAMDGFDYVAAQAMIDVILGDESGKDEMEQWFIKAIEANPDFLPTYTTKMYFLEPKWYGSPEEMLSFGRECVATLNFASGAPLQLAAAHDAISQYSASGYSLRPVRAYFQAYAPAVWNDVCAGYIATLALYPNNYRVRSNFARYAVWCGHYREAAQQFKILGDNADVVAFGSLSDFEELREEAMSHANDAEPAP